MSKRVAVISDIHGNWHALEAVLAAVELEAPDELWCLGDLVGYGPRPNECCAAVAQRARICLAGNHDLGVLGAIDLGEFSADAAETALWTRGELDDSARAFLSGLAPSGRLDGAELFHASPRDPVWDYVLTYEAARHALELTEAPVVLVGHSHVPLVIGFKDGAVTGGAAAAGAEAELGDGRWLLNPGSVGQPRDGDPRASWLLLEPGRKARYRRVEYAVERTQAEIRERGLPDALAERLAHGC